MSIFFERVSCEYYLQDLFLPHYWTLDNDMFSRASVAFTFKEAVRKRVTLPYCELKVHCFEILWCTEYNNKGQGLRVDKIN